VLVRIFLTALLICSLAANIALFVSPYQWENDKYPPWENGTQQTRGEDQGTKPANHAGKIHIECEPNCSAKATDNGSDEPWALRA